MAATVSHLSCPVLTDLSFCYVLAILSSLSFPAYTIPTFSGCPAQAFLSQLSCPSILVHSSFIALSYLSCPTCLVLGALSSKSYTDCSVLNVLSWLSWLSCPECLVLAVKGRPYMADQNVKNLWTALDSSFKRKKSIFSYFRENFAKIFVIFERKFSRIAKINFRENTKTKIFVSTPPAPL